jgi:hypothetical protein
MEYAFFESSFIIEGTTEKIYKFCTLISRYLVRQAPKTSHFSQIYKCFAIT